MTIEQAFATFCEDFKQDAVEPILMVAFARGAKWQEGECARIDRELGLAVETVHRAAKM